VSEAQRPEAIAREIRDDILRGRYRPGERLPYERELALQAGANRGSAREALKLLAQQRLIEIRPGGARVILLHRASLDVLMIRPDDGSDPALMAAAAVARRADACRSGRSGRARRARSGRGRAGDPRAAAPRARVRAEAARA
jgi:DNA-binding FadR family transcriptional regulator